METPGKNIHWGLAIIKAGWTIELTANRKAYVAVNPRGQRWRVFWHGNEAHEAQTELAKRADDGRPAPR